jgi:hypothetical protein
MMIMLRLAWLSFLLVSICQVTTAQSHLEFVADSFGVATPHVLWGMDTDARIVARLDTVVLEVGPRPMFQLTCDKLFIINSYAFGSELGRTTNIAFAFFEVSSDGIQLKEFYSTKMNHADDTPSYFELEQSGDFLVFSHHSRGSSFVRQYKIELASYERGDIELICKEFQRWHKLFRNSKLNSPRAICGDGL